MNPTLKRILRYLGYGLLILLVLLLVGVGYIWLHSPGTTAPLVDEKGKPVPNSIAVLEQVELNGTKQWILIRGYDRTKPVLLILHGGPGSSEMPLFTNNEALEKRFVVVNWDQRGAGKSYDPDLFNDAFTLQTFIDDTADLSRLLAERFRQPGSDSSKIYLMGHSWGTFLGIQTVEQHPELFRGYLGIGQVANQLLGEQLSYDWVLKQAKQRNDDDNVERLTEFGRPPYETPERWMDYLLPQRNMVAQYGGSLHKGSFNDLVFQKLLFCQEYTLSDKMNYMVGALKTIERLWSVVINTNLNQTTPAVKIPVYIFQGLHDYQTPYSVAQDYFNRLQAPQKQFFTFDKSAHGPVFEEPELFLKRVDEVVKN